MKFRDYEQLGQPDGISIIATRRALRQGGGEPTINHANLEELLEEDLHLPDFGVKLYDGSQLGVAPKPLDVWRSGYPTLWNKTLHVPVANTSGANPMTRLIAAGLAAGTRQELKLPLRYWGTELITASGGALVVGAITGSDSATVGGLAGLSVTGYGKALADHQTPLERFKLETRELRADHERDIVFPNQRDARYLQPE